MKLRLVAGVIMFFVMVGVALGAVFIGPSLLSRRSATDLNSLDASSAQQPLVAGNAIARENAQPGTNNWKIPLGREAGVQIQAYANSTYVLPGKSITFYVSTKEQGATYSIDIYRLGWYGGFGGRLMASSGVLIGQAQGYYDTSNRRLVACTSCIIDKKTRLIEADWKPSYKLTVPSDWTTGVYLAKFTDAQGLQTYAPFDVLSNSSSKYLVVTPDTTYAAYNTWGGSSLYELDNGFIGETDGTAKGTKVSFDKPYVQGNGASQVLLFEVNAIRWLERQGYDLSYISNVNLHDDPSQLLRHKAYISLGHDEYWTKEMRDGVELARDKGVGLAFLGANASYWQMRFEPDSAGVPNRTVVCYKVETVKNDLARDPLYGVDNTRLTTQWRDPALARPENALIGIMYSDLTHNQQGFPWQVSTTANSPLLEGTGLQAGQKYGCGLVGYEWDRIFKNGATPKGLQVLGTSATLNDTNKVDSSNTTYYIASSGAMVFATGSIYWTEALDTYRPTVDKTCGNQNTAVLDMQILMAHIMDGLIIHHPLNS